MERKIIYVNRTTVTTNINEFIIKLDLLSPVYDENSKVTDQEISDSVLAYMSPEQAKSVSLILNHVVKHYEKTFGKIPTNEEVKNIIDGSATGKN